MSVLEKILTFFYPKRCLLCGRAGAVNEDELCADCAKLQPDIRVRFSRCMQEDGITHWNAVRRSGTRSRFGHPCGGSSSKTERTLRNRLQS